MRLPARHRSASAALAAWMVGATIVGGPSIARAHGGEGLAHAETPPAPPGDGQAAEQALAALAADRAPGDEKASAEAEASARKALERAHGARVSGDEPHGGMLSSLALGFAELARELVRALRFEAKAATAQKALDDERAATERARLLLAEAQTRLERARADLQKANEEAAAARQKADEAEAERLAGKGGKPKAGKKPKAAAKPKGKGK